MNLFIKNFWGWIGLGCLVTMLLLWGCQSTASLDQSGEPGTNESPTTTVRPQAMPTGNLPDPIETSLTPAVTEEPADQPQSIIFWMIESISPEAEGAPGDFISNTFRDFRRSNPTVEVDLLIKKPSGKGGVLDFLRTARAVAPDVLPDVVIMNAADLPQAYADGLIQPLDGRLDRSIVQDLLPAARKMGTIDEQLMGVPIGLELEHTVYNGRLFAEAPLLWRDVFSANTTYIFPAQGVNGVVNDTTLAQYLSAGGKLRDEEGQPTLDEGALRQVLETYQQAVDNKTLLPMILEAPTVETLWPSYLESEAGIAQISVKQFLADRDLLNYTQLTSLPVQNSEDTPVLITHGWALVLITDAKDLQRQTAALQLIEWFMSTANNADWNEINRTIPVRDTAYQQVAEDDPYWEFLAEQLKMAQPQPGFVGYDQLSRILQQAVVQVISEQATPEEATATAIDAITQ